MQLNLDARAIGTELAMDEFEQIAEFVAGFAVAVAANRDPSTWAGLCRLMAMQIPESDRVPLRWVLGDLLAAVDGKLETLGVVVTAPEETGELELPVQAQPTERASKAKWG